MRQGPLVPGLETLGALHSTRKWRWLHDAYTAVAIFGCSHGEGTWTYRRRVHRGGAGVIALMEPGEVTTTGATPPCDFRAFCFDPSFVRPAAASLGWARGELPHFRIVASDEPRLFELFRRLNMAVGARAARLELESCASACLRALLEDCSDLASARAVEPRSAPENVRRARDYIRERFAGPIGLDELSAATGLSPFHLVRCFARAFGLPPHAYQLQLRAAEARRLLADGNSLADVAASVGFADQSHLSRQFRKIVGLTPGLYQASSAIWRRPRTRTARTYKTMPRGLSTF